MKTKQDRRETILALVDAQLNKIKQAKADMGMLLKQLDGEWVIRQRWLDGSRSDQYWGTRNPGDTCRQEGFVFFSPDGVSKGFSGKVSGVKMSKSPRDMVFIAECEAARDRKYETQDKYVIEVVDRLDGEVYEIIEKPWRYDCEDSVSSR